MSQWKKTKMVPNLLPQASVLLVAYLMFCYMIVILFYITEGTSEHNIALLISNVLIGYAFYIIFSEKAHFRDKILTSILQ